MTITTDELGRTVLTADEGRAIHRKGTSTPCSIVGSILRPDDSPANWEDCDLGEPEPPSSDEPTMADKDAALRRFGVEVGE